MQTRWPGFILPLLLAACATPSEDQTAAQAHSQRAHVTKTGPNATIVCFGDSTTANRSVDGQALPVYPRLLRDRLAAVGLPGPVINSGVRGSHTGRRADNAHHKVAHARDRFDAAVRDQQPDAVIIQFGLNDCWVDDDADPERRQPRTPLGEFHSNLNYFVDTLHADGIAVVLMTPNPLGGRFPKWRSDLLRSYAETVRFTSRTKHTALVDVHRMFGEHTDGPDALLLDGMHPNAAGHGQIADALIRTLQDMHASGQITPRDTRRPTHFTLPTIDIGADRGRQIVVDREKGQYLGHPTTVLLEDHKTMIAVYPKGHGKGAIVMKRSTDTGLTWSQRLPVPANWSTSQEVPTIHRVVDAKGRKRLIVFSGLYPCRLAVSEDDGRTFSPLRKVGDWGGIVVMGCVVELRQPGRYLAMFHDDGRFFSESGMAQYERDRAAGKPRVFRVYKTFSDDGGLTWSFPETVWMGSELHLCEPGAIRSPDGQRIAVLLRENSRRRNSHVIFSDDEGETFTEPKELPAALTGDRHTGKYAPDGRLFISFRDTALVSATKGDWVGWVGTFADLEAGRSGQYRVRLMDNKNRWDCAYPGVEVLPDGTFVTTTYGHWERGEKPYVVSVRFRLDELDAMAVPAKGR